MDFCFLGDGGKEENLSVLVVREKDTRMTMLTVLPSRKIEAVTAERITAFMRACSCVFAEIVLKSIQEPTMIALGTESGGNLFLTWTRKYGHGLRK